MNWKYYEPKFEYEKKFQDIGWPWAGHKYFAYDLVANFKPKKIVELGTHYGTSLWSFSQAAKDQNIDTELNAIDTWEGEQHAGFYGEEVYETVNNIKRDFYQSIKIKLIRETFDEAVKQFNDDSIDVLHIDGLHTYDAVKHDFQTWFPKVRNDGIIIFHDIKVANGDFGVYKYWEELKKEYSTIQFYHSFGLGILFKKKEIAVEFMQIEEAMQMHYSYIHEMSRCLNIQQKEIEFQKTIKEYELMKTSKFWKLRNKYLALKSTIKAQNEKS